MAGCKCLDLLKSFLSYASSDVRPILLSLLFTFINYKSWQMWRMAASHISSLVAQPLYMLFPDSWDAVPFPSPG